MKYTHICIYTLVSTKRIFLHLFAHNMVLYTRLPIAIKILHTTASARWLYKIMSLLLLQRILPKCDFSHTCFSNAFSEHMYTRDRIQILRAHVHA